MARGQAGGGLNVPTNEACIAATGCSAAELVSGADTIPVGTLARALGLTDHDAAADGFRTAALAALASVGVVSDSE